jgi:50S ribosomal protein L16 3-hydroxylase
MLFVKNTGVMMEYLFNKGDTILIKTFLDEYWGKKPLFLKNVFENASEFANKEDFYEMAIDEEFETRLVEIKEGNFKVSEGPFDKGITKRDNLKTLVCHNLNLYAPQFYELEKLMSFRPHWEFDDVMATISDKNASLGAHIDNYHVFIIQGQGSRKWQLQLNPNHEYLPEQPIRVLKEFNPDITWELSPGDVIYIPPHVAHHGISLDDSISYSVGFKALDKDKMMQRYFTDLIEHFDDNGFYQTANKQESVSDKHQLDTNDINTVHHAFTEDILPIQYFSHWLLKDLSMPRRMFTPGPTLLRSDLNQAIKNGSEMFKDPFFRYYFLKETDRYLMCIGGKEFWIENETDFKQLTELFSSPPFEAIEIGLTEFSQEVEFVLLCLIENGALYLTE